MKPALTKHRLSNPGLIGQLLKAVLMSVLQGFGSRVAMSFLVAGASLCPAASASCANRSTSGVAADQGSRYAIPASCFTNAGWAAPVPLNDGRLFTGTHADFRSPTYRVNNGFIHGGLDLLGSLQRGVNEFSTSTPVFAIADGVIEHVGLSNASVLNTSVVVVRHNPANGRPFWSLYGHTYADGGIFAGVTVRRGDRLGSLRPYNEMHLHLEILELARPNWAIWGPFLDGYTVSPLEFLGSTANTLVPRSEIDGVGSLIDPRAGGSCNAADINAFGCSRDEVMLHASSKASTGVFQVHTGSTLTGGDRCDSLRLSGLQRAYVGVRRWNEAYPGANGGFDVNRTGIFYAQQLPLEFVPPKGFVIVTVTTDGSIPPGETRRVRLECVPGPTAAPQWKRLTPSPLEASLQETLGVFRASSQLFVGDQASGLFGGNGSLLEFSGNASTESFGQLVDYARSTADGYSETFFQVFALNKCRRLRIDSSVPSREVSLVAIKQWAQPAWTSLYRNTTLPKEFSVEAGQYLIVRIRDSKPVGGRVIATCIG